MIRFLTVAAISCLAFTSASATDPASRASPPAVARPQIPPAPAAVTAAGTMAQPSNILTVPLPGIDGKMLADTGDPKDSRAGAPDHTVSCLTNKWCPPLTLRVLAVAVLNASWCGDPRVPCPPELAAEKDLPQGQKWARAELARQIYQHPESVTLSAEEKVLLKRLIGTVYPGQIVADVMPLLDPAAKPEAIKP